MQLLYLWIDMDTNPIRNLGLQLSDNYCLDFDYNTKILHYHKKERNVNLFSRYFKSITNVTAIVGENGCGKTTLMKEMFDLLRREKKACRYLAVYCGDKIRQEQDAVYYWWSNLENTEDGDAAENAPFVAEGFPRDSLCRLTKEDVEDAFFFVRYTDVLSLSEYAKQDLPTTNNSCDLTTAYRFLSLNDEAARMMNQSTQDPLLQFYHMETEKQIQAIDGDFKVILQGLTILPCRDLEVQDVIKIDESFGKWQTIGDDVPQRKKGRELCKKLLCDMNSWENIEAKDIIIKSIIYTYLRYAIRSFGIFKENAATGAGIAAAIDREFNVPIRYWLSELESIRKETDKTKIKTFFVKSFESVGVTSGTEKFAENLQLLMEKLLHSDEINFDKNVNQFHIDLSKIETDELLDIYRCYKDSIGQFGEAFAFEMGMSSGERAFFNLWAYMKYAKERLDKADNPQIIRKNHSMIYSTRSIIIFFDELDAFLHPRWQQMSIDKILSRVSSIFDKNEIQIIFSTHSPILLSDIPLSHVIYLERYNENTKIVPKHNQTFADNIYRLYMDSFFLNLPNNNGSKDKIWIHGAFAGKVIDKIEKTLARIRRIVINDCRSEEHSLDDCAIQNVMSQMEEIYCVINIIGEPFLQNILMNEWNEIKLLLAGYADPSI